MPMFSRPAVGIDLGTTFSAVAYLDDLGRPVTLANAEGDLITPSVVLFEGTQAVIGKEAVKALATDAELVALCAKRELGNRTFPQVIGGRQYPPEVIQAFILNKLRNDTRQKLGDFHQVVITVPAYFDETRRKATQDAGYMAALDVLDIINEPTAAAIAYGSRHHFLDSSGEARAPVKLLVYDLGGGTFDVTVMEIAGQNFNTVATDGDVRLGGRDWDQRLMDYAAEEFLRSHGIDPREDPNAFGRLWRECEEAKRTLSARMKTTFSFDFRGKALRLEVSRDAFQEMSRDLLDRTRFTTEQTLRASGLNWSQIDHVLMVGGSTRMPMVIDMLAQISGKQPDASISADEAVAQGAALRAGMMLAKSSKRREPFKIRNVNSHSLGVVGTDPQTKRKRNAVLIPRNTPLPVSAKRVFKTQKPNQRSILVQIVEGESMSPDDCSQLGKCSIRDLPPNLPAGTPIEVRFRYEENGRLAIHISIAGSNRPIVHELTRENSLTPEQLDIWRQYITGTAPKAENAKPEKPAGNRWK